MQKKYAVYVCAAAALLLAAECCGTRDFTLLCSASVSMAERLGMRDTLSCCCAFETHAADGHESRDSRFGVSRKCTLEPAEKAVIESVGALQHLHDESIRKQKALLWLFCCSWHAMLEVSQCRLQCLSWSLLLSHLCPFGVQCVRRLVQRFSSCASIRTLVVCRRLACTRYAAFRMTGTASV